MKALPTTAPEPRLGERIVSLADVCQAAVELLHGASLSRPFIARREWLPVFDLAELGTETKVAVTAGDGYQTTRISRTSWQREPQIRVLVFGALQGDAIEDQVDALMSFVEEVRDLFAFADLRLDASVECPPVLRAIAIESDPPLSAEALEQLRQFSSVLTITYRVHDAT